MNALDESLLRSQLICSSLLSLFIILFASLALIISCCLSLGLLSIQFFFSLAFLPCFDILCYDATITSPILFVLCAFGKLLYIKAKKHHHELHRFILLSLIILRQIQIINSAFNRYLHRVLLKMRTFSVHL